MVLEPLSEDPYEESYELFLLNNNLVLKCVVNRTKPPRFQKTEAGKIRLSFFLIGSSVRDPALAEVTVAPRDTAAHRTLRHSDASVPDAADTAATADTARPDTATIQTQATRRGFADATVAGGTVALAARKTVPLARLCHIRHRAVSRCGCVAPFPEA